MVIKYLVRILLPWGAIPMFPRVGATPKVHVRLIPWYTSGFE